MMAECIASLYSNDKTNGDTFTGESWTNFRLRASYMLTHTTYVLRLWGKLIEIPGGAARLLHSVSGDVYFWGKLALSYKAYKEVHCG